MRVLLHLHQRCGMFVPGRHRAAQSPWPRNVLSVIVADENLAYLKIDAKAFDAAQAEALARAMWCPFMAATSCGGPAGRGP